MLMVTVTQEYVSTTLPMLVNALMQLVTTVIQRLISDNPDDADQMQKVTLSKFIVRTTDMISQQCHKL